jgi:uncharacterized protein YjbI with pentapeptide repeats
MRTKRILAVCLLLLSTATLAEGLPVVREACMIRPGTVCADMFLGRMDLRGADLALANFFGADTTGRRGCP